MAQCSVGLHCCALQCWYHLTKLMGSIQKDQHPKASLSKWGALGEQESPMQALGRSWSAVVRLDGATAAGSWSMP